MLVGLFEKYPKWIQMSDEGDKNRWAKRSTRGILAWPDDSHLEKRDAPWLNVSASARDLARLGPQSFGIGLNTFKNLFEHVWTKNAQTKNVKSFKPTLTLLHGESCSKHTSCLVARNQFRKILRLWTPALQTWQLHRLHRRSNVDFTGFSFTGFTP